MNWPCSGEICILDIGLAAVSSRSRRCSAVSRSETASR